MKSLPSETTTLTNMGKISNDLGQDVFVKLSGGPINPLQPFSPTANYSDPAAFTFGAGTLYVFDNGKIWGNGTELLGDAYTTGVINSTFVHNKVFYLSSEDNRIYKFTPSNLDNHKYHKWTQELDGLSSLGNTLYGVSGESVFSFDVDTLEESSFELSGTTFTSIHGFSGQVWATDTEGAGFIDMESQEYNRIIHWPDTWSATIFMNGITIPITVQEQPLNVTYLFVQTDDGKVYIVFPDTASSGQDALWQETGFTAGTSIPGLHFVSNDDVSDSLGAIYVYTTGDPAGYYQISGYDFSFGTPFFISGTTGQNKAPLPSLNFELGMGPTAATPSVLEVFDTDGNSLQSLTLFYQVQNDTNQFFYLQDNSSIPIPIDFAGPNPNALKANLGTGGGNLIVVTAMDLDPGNQF